MSAFETASITEGYQGACQDCVAVFDEGQRLVIAVADGAGGSGYGAEAAATVVSELRSAAAHADSADRWSAALRQIDFRIPAGESTAVVVDVRPDGLCGASVGDSQAWIVRLGELTNLTAGQRRKPLLGSGEAQPVGFEHGPLDGILLVATDGLCNYVKRPELVKTLPQLPFAVIPRRLLEMVRLPSGELWDDVGVVVCRRRPRSQRRTGRVTLTMEDFV